MREDEGPGGHTRRTGRRTSWDLWRGTGFFTQRYSRFGGGLRWFGYGYFAVMVIRYLITMVLFPEPRWLGSGTIPIVFHWVLAAFLFAQPGLCIGSCNEATKAPT